MRKSGKIQKIVELLIAVIIIVLAIDSEGARPFSTDDAEVVEKGKYELEIGYDSEQNEGLIKLELKHGLTEKMDIGIGLGYTITSLNENHLTGAELCLKYALIPDLLAASG